MSAPRSDPALVALRQRIAAIEGDHGPPPAVLPFGLAEVSVLPASAGPLTEALQARGWQIQS